MRGPIELLQDAFAIFQKNPKLFISIYAVLGVFMIITEFFTPYHNDPSDITSPLVALLSLVTAAVSIFTTIALIRAISEPETTTFKSAYEFAKKDALQYFVLSIMVGVVVIVGFVLLIIPGLIALTWFGFAYCTLLFEGKRGFEAMKASKAMVDGRFMPVFGRYVAIFAVTILVAIVASMFGSIFSSKLAETVLFTIAYAVLMPVMLGYVYLMYRDVKAQGVYQPVPAAAPAAPVVAESASSVDTAEAPLDVPSSDNLAETNENRAQ